MNPLAAIDFRGNGRFEVRSRIGQGAVGIVYDAYDRERKTRVALKTLRTTNPETLLLLKKEFRAVQDILHTNLVHMGELFEEKGTWFFTMEFVQGAHFIQYVRPHDPRAKASAPAPSVLPMKAMPGGFDEARLRAALAQIVRGLNALHEADKVHRDVKPSNILVTESGRVVILDFGIAADLVRDVDSSEQGMMGTAAYMAPEQALGEQLSAATDWYGVGVILYQALSGRLPFHGAMHEIMAAKLHEEPPPVTQYAPDAPADLAQLCTDLLRMLPGDRPSGREILERIGAATDDMSSARQHAAAVFVGRETELGALETAFADVHKGNAVTVFVHGESGVGKSFLVRRFLDAARARDRSALVIAGRCYERESVPYKAVDGVIDQLARHLSSLGEAERRDLLPEHASLLARAFPVLSEVAAGKSAIEVVNPQELRARVFGAMRELFQRIAARRPLIVSIDDLQWADVDSLALLGDVMRPPNAPSMLLVATLRVGTERHLRGTQEQVAALQISGDVRHIVIDQLPHDEARALALRLLGDDGADDETIEAIVNESHGHPLYIDELVRQRASPISGTVLRLDDALWARITRLEPTARRLLELVAVGGLPIAQEVAAHAAAIDMAQLFDLAGVLRAANFVKTAGAHKEDAIEPYHDRVRESVVAHLDDPSRARWHGRLAAALEHVGSSDVEALATHWEGAGNNERASGYAERAADAAMQALAFERAARLYRKTLELRAHTREAARDLQRRLAEALTNAGYVSQAAEVYLGLAQGAEPVEALDLRRRAAEQLLCSGRFESGYEILRNVLHAVGVYFPKSPIAVIFSVLIARIALALRGLKFEARDAATASPRALVRADAVWAAGAGFSMTDNIRGAYFQTRNLLAVMRIGDPQRVVRALGMEVCFRAAGGVHTRERTRALLAKEWALAEKVQTPEAMAMANTASGYFHYMLGEWRDAKKFLSRGEELFRDRCIGVTFQLNSTRVMLYRALAYLGDLRELGRRAPAALREVEKQADYYSLVNLETGPMAILRLAADEPDRLREANEDAAQRLARGAFLVQHYFALLAQCMLDLYRGDGAAAHGRIVAAWPALRRSLLLRVQAIAVQSIEQRCRCAITAASSRTSASEDLLRLAERDTNVLVAHRMPWAVASATMLRGSIAAARGHTAEAAPLFADAAERFAALDMTLFAAVSRRRQGELLGGGRGAELVRDADAAFEAQGVRDIERFAAVLAPPVRRA